MPTRPDHYFTAAPDSPDQRRTLRVSLAGRSLTVQTARGVFCPERVDQGTAVLLREVPDPPEAGAVLDLGCGWGPIALALGLLAPETDVWAVDVNERALDLARSNAETVGLQRFHASTPDSVPDEIRFATIWSNPPIRVGKNALHDLLGHWLPRLEPGATAYLVIAKNLGADSLQRWLADTLGVGFTVARLASDKGFRVLSVRRAVAVSPT